MTMHAFHLSATGEAGSRHREALFPESRRPYNPRREMPVGFGENGDEPEPSRALPLVVEQRVLDLLRDWTPILIVLGVGAAAADRAARRAVSHQSNFARELVLAGVVEEVALFRAIANELGLTFQEQVKSEAMFGEDRQSRALLGARDANLVVRILREDSVAVYALSDYGIDLARWRDRLDHHDELVERIVVVPPTALRAALIERASETLLRDAIQNLRLSMPLFSAHDVATPWQAWLSGVLACLLPVSLVVAPANTILALSMIATIAFFSCVALRLLALPMAAPLRPPSFTGVDPARMPVYSVLVALHREKAVVPQLLVALGKLQWPRSRLEIKLVCEADDEETLAALRAHRLHPCIEVVRVPPALPRTKPKALAYALPLCSGDLVTLYDAEDRPHPLQLMEAWQRFNSESETLACLQAPLVITNYHGGWLTRMFAFEYAGLFRALLPWLAARNSVVPLGGTSNHFRRAALDDVGGWDPFNVTEDADLGLRLRRRGYRVGTLSLPTYEDGPESLRVWLPQRTRWFKGWIQTWLVHMREPVRLAGELGARTFLTAQVLYAGMVASALMHPLFLATFIYVLAKLTLSGDLNGRDSLLALFSTANIIGGYGAFILICLFTLDEKERRSLRLSVLATPLHWILLSVAAWRAIYELIRAPHRCGLM